MLGGGGRALSMEQCPWRATVHWVNKFFPPGFYGARRFIPYSQKSPLLFHILNQTNSSPTPFVPHVLWFRFFYALLVTPPPCPILLSFINLIINYLKKSTNESPLYADSPATQRPRRERTACCLIRVTTCVSVKPAVSSAPRLTVLEISEGFYV